MSDSSMPDLQRGILVLTVKSKLSARDLSTVDKEDTFQSYKGEAI